MNEMKDRFKDYASEYLLELRARGDDLSEQAHSAIEEIFNERNEAIPPRPKQAVAVENRNKAMISAKNSAMRFTILFLGVLLFGAGKVFAHTYAGIVIAIICAGYYFWSKNKKSKLTPEEIEVAKNEKITKSESLTELMICSAEGRIERMKELLDYGNDPNTRSNSGSTALMYAARNNQNKAVEFLLTRGANPALKNNTEKTALDLAIQFNLAESIAILQQKQ